VALNYWGPMAILVFSLHWTIFSCVSSTVPFGRTLLNKKSAQSQSGRKMFHTGLKVFDKVATVRRSLHATELSPVRLETARTMREGGEEEDSVICHFPHHLLVVDGRLDFFVQTGNNNQTMTRTSARQEVRWGNGHIQWDWRARTK
jgi:hypothetical protein